MEALGVWGEGCQGALSAVIGLGPAHFNLDHDLGPVLKRSKCANSTAQAVDINI